MAEFLQLFAWTLGDPPGVTGALLQLAPHLVRPALHLHRKFGHLRGAQVFQGGMQVIEPTLQFADLTAFPQGTRRAAAGMFGLAAARPDLLHFPNHPLRFFMAALALQITGVFPHFHQPAFAFPHPLTRTVTRVADNDTAFNDDLLAGCLVGGPFGCFGGIGGVNEGDAGQNQQRHAERGGNREA
jgi:hypothetical protein